MRPQSIIMFERLFLASLVVSAVSAAIVYDELVNLFANDPGMEQLGLGAGFVTALVGASFAIYLLLWYLIARKASNLAKWILVVFVAIGAATALRALAGPWTLSVALNFAVYALEVAALAFLFRDDAKAWLAGERPADPSTFD